MPAAVPPSTNDAQADVRIPRRDVAEWVFRLFVLVVTSLAIPHFAWVWSADRRLNVLEQQQQATATAITRIEAMAEATRDKSMEQGADLKLMQRDLAYLREGIDDLRGRPVRSR